ncbi:LOW QUALITY PROTEIN: hypothetical protein U9M48_018821 [Paspalum notatum var. saurae]|uniref:Retrotransposon gag domain-containing protein n=1 Tax=Paspalum notatum var. saurae TaxID=547442 RepID=A0AAQ3TAU2_PASNO
MASHNSGNTDNVVPEAVAEGQGDNGQPAAAAVAAVQNPTATGEQSGNSGAESHTHPSQRARTPPPPPNPIVELTQNLVRCIEGIAQRAPPPQQGRAQNLMGEFMKLRPTPFAGSHDPLEAYDWIKTIERKLEIINCDEPTKPWPLINSLGQHWPGGKVTVKLTEGKLPGKDSGRLPQISCSEAARDLKAKNSEAEANTMTMQEYIEKFTTLSRYAPEEVNTDPKKCKCFIRGLNPEIKSIVHSNEAPSFATLINRVIQIEEDKREEKSQLKRKFMEIKSQRQERRFRQKSFGGQVSWGSYAIRLSSMTLVPASSVASLGIFSSAVLNRCDQQHPPSPTQ